MIEAVDIALGALAIIVGGFWMIQARKAMRQDKSKAIFWLGPIQAKVFQSLMRKSPNKQDTYVAAIVAGNILIVLLLLVLL